MNTLAERLREHFGNNVEIAMYGDEYCLEDMDTNEVIFDSDIYDLQEPISEMSSSDLFASMTDTQKDDIYRMVWFDRVCEDVHSFLTSEYNGDVPTDTYEYDALIRDVANAYVYNGDYDCNTDYWTQIWSLVDKYAR